jgi:N-methylhydantoinase A
MGVFVAVDTGGTFTDLVMFDSASRDVRYTKALTTHADPIEAVLECVSKANVDLVDTDVLRHGTTHVINILLERAGPVLALVTTAGFRDVLEIGRGNRTEPFNLFYRRDPPLVPREFRFEIAERIDGGGNILQAPDYREVERLAGRLRELGVTAVAVSFINAYLDPSHERLVAGWLRELLPGCYLSTGAELTREWHEFERTATAAANAYTGPKIGRYVDRLNGGLRAHGFEGSLLMMGSNGGVLSAPHAAAAPILLVESGPVGGCIGASAYGEALGLSNLVALDMGGTTAKCALVRNGRFDVQSIYHIGGYGRGIPVRMPVLDIVEIGAGGGSIAWLDDQNSLGVGPRSAGSSPGPVCYGRGGTEPTVTDANLVIGRLDPKRFQGGEMGLDVAGARRAIQERLAVPLGYHGEEGLLEIACGILSIATVKMSEMIKRITVQRGHDARDFALFAYGGGGPLHAFELAREMAIPLVVIPPEAGNFSAIGMLLADIRRDESRTLICRLDAGALAAVELAFRDMEEALQRSLAQDFPDAPVVMERSVEMRYVGQYHTVLVPLRTSDVDEFRRTFEEVYIRRYGHGIAGVAPETVSLHSTATVRTPHPDIAHLAALGRTTGRPEIGTRAIFFPEMGRETMTNVYTRSALPMGFAADGPAVIQEYGSTTVVGPRDRFEVGALGEIRIHIHVNGDGRGFAP